MFEALRGPEISDDADWLPLVDDELALTSPPRACRSPRSIR
jgi:hypothetical protein